MRVAILVLSILFSVLNIYAQKIQYLKKGNSFYKEKEYTNAVIEYEKLWYSTSGVKLMGVDAKMNLANCYRIIDEPFKAHELYAQVIDYAEDKLPVYLEYGKVLMSLGHYDAAIRQFELYAEKNDKSEEPAKLIQQCIDIEDIEAIFRNAEVSNQFAINDSITRQIGVTYYGDAVVIASDELEEGIGDYRTRSFLNMRACGVDSKGDLKGSEKFSHSLNAPDRHDGPATFSRDGIHVIFSLSATTSEGSYLQLWESHFKNQKWSAATPLPFLLIGSNFTHPSLSANGKALYFASDMKGSLGGLDIWETHYELGTWTKPMNLGTDINTSSDDAWPYIHPDGDLYFSSKGHPGFGGYDVFRSRPLGNGIDWLPIENLGQPFNSSFSDISFIMSDDQTQGFFASNRAKSYDIFRYIIIGAEKQTLPDDIKPRKNTGLSEIGHETILDTDFPEQTDNMTDVEYVEHLKKLNEEGKLTLPNVTNHDHQHENNPDVFTEDNVNNTNENKNNTNNNSTNINPEEEGVVLSVLLRVMDVKNSRPLTNAKVVVKNKFTQKEEVLQVNGNGEIEVRLEPDQKYSLTGQSEGYKESSLPVSTMGVVSSHRVQANLPLEKE